jgi:hypothetical protein
VPRRSEVEKVCSEDMVVASGEEVGIRMVEDVLVQSVIAQLAEELAEARRDGYLDDLEGITCRARRKLFIISQVETNE